MWFRTPYVFFLLYAMSFIHTIDGRDCKKSWRRAWRDLSCEQQDEFLEALTLVKESGLYDDFVYIHEFHATLTHSTPEFLPWHR
jgi:hypothetical protein